MTAREIVLDTETTGIDPRAGHRLIEIGCVELMGRLPTGREFHAFINPERDVPADAVAVHGITGAFLADKPKFAAVVDEFLAFIADAPLVIHNATFDVGFINSELERVKRKPLQMTRVVDTLALARRRNPGGPNSLDALCKRFGIDNSKRTKHGALVDSLLLAEVYMELLGERQTTLALVGGPARGTSGRGQQKSGGAKARTRPLAPRLTAEAEAEHAKFVETLGPNALWKKRDS
ncbi:MAG TPA: DNA polymerase III subunit epsilon [Hyphomicrobiaceae bacterium]|nr:DNA polymerase III subunit epsilon [Hyphomicrobiaceae bacterium]